MRACLGVASFFGATFMGMFAATQLCDKFDGKKLQKAFAYFTLVIAAIILLKELF